MNRRNFFAQLLEPQVSTHRDPVRQTPDPRANKTLPKLAASTAGINPYTGTFGRTQIRHLLRRTMFGAKPADVDFFSGKTLAQTINTLLTTTPEPAPPLNHYSGTGTFPNPSEGVALGETWVHLTTVDPTINFIKNQSYSAWWVGLMIHQTHSIQEKMVLFWHNHFATEINESGDARYLYFHNKTLRQYALGNFKAFTKAITLDTLMLYYLNGFRNVKRAPDENYARELQELFTVGKDLNPHYTEDDVKAAARILTGWSINRNVVNGPTPPNWLIFKDNDHDTTDKQFSSFYNNKKITGRSGQAGALQELDELLDMIFDHPETARYICRKLYRFFVYYVIDDTVEANVITPLADIFRRNNYEIKPVLEALFSSEHFFDALQQSCVIKNPVDYLIGMAREMDLTFPDATDVKSQYNAFVMIHQLLNQQQMGPGNPPNVAGWPAYWQEPQYHELWISADTLPKRKENATGLILNGIRIPNAAGKTLKIDVIKYTETFAHPEDPNKLIQELCERILSYDISDSHKDEIKKSALLSGQSSDYYWTDAWNSYKTNPTNNTFRTEVLNRLNALYTYLLALPEYHLS
jgi:uncharacterized protein (DUF1800 family)